MSEGKLIVTAKFALHKGRSDLNSQQQFLKVRVSPHIHQCWLLSSFDFCQFDNQKCPPAGLICISKMIEILNIFSLGL